jgi:hypothetical protein
VLLQPHVLKVKNGAQGMLQVSSVCVGRGGVAAA